MNITSNIIIGKITKYDPIKKTGEITSNDQIIYFSSKYVKILWLDKYDGRIIWRNRDLQKNKTPQIGDEIYCCIKKDKYSGKSLANCWGFCEESASDIYNLVSEKLDITETVVQP